MSAAAIEFDPFLEWKLNFLRDQIIALAIDLHCNLFTNNITLTPDTEVGDLTLASGGGLNRKVEDANNWADAVVTEHVAVMESNVLHTWTRSGSTITIYGYVVTNDDETIMYFGETFATPIVLIATQSLTIQTRIKDRSQMF